MPAPLFLELDQVMRLHASMIEHYGGTNGIRDIGLLQSALAVPQASYGGASLHADLFEMAAAYLFHIVQNHPFLDGNKRTGAASAIIFLAINGFDTESDEEGLVELTLSVARGESDKSTIAGFFRARCS